MRAPAALVSRSITPELDLLLDLLLLMRVPGARFTHDEIAQFCGCSDSAILDIERRALRKLRKAATARGLEIEDLATFLS